MVARTDAPRSQTIVRQVPSIDGERFCILPEVALSAANAFEFITAADWLTWSEVCDRLIAAGISEPDVYRLLDEARAGHGPFDVV